MFFSLLFTVGQRLSSDASDALSSSSVTEFSPGVTHISEKQALCPAWWPGSTLSVTALVRLRLRCLGRAGKSTRGCRHQVTRKTTASCGGVLGERSEGMAELSADTRRGTRRRSRHTCKHQHTNRSSTFSCCTRRPSACNTSILHQCSYDKLNENNICCVYSLSGF